MILGLVTSQLWKGGAIAGAVTSIALAGTLGVVILQKKGVEKERDKLHAAIYAPIDGYIAQGVRCRANVTRLDTALNTQNTAIESLRKTSADRLAQSQRDLAAAQRTAAEFRVKANQIRTATPVGVTQCDRILDVDAMIKDAFQ